MVNNTKLNDDNQWLVQPQKPPSDVKTVFFYREGDQRFAPVRVVLNRRKYPSMEALMNDLGHRVQLPRGVRSLFTPKGRHQITSLTEIENGGSYLCSSHNEMGKGVDVANMLVEPRPFIAAKSKGNDIFEESRYLRTGLLADEPSDDELYGSDIRGRIRRKQQVREFTRLKDEEKMRGKDAHWAERVRRVVLIRNGEPDVVKHYALTTATATNMFKIKADFSAMFGLPVERVYSVDGRLVLDVEDMFRSDSSAFIISFGDHFKPMTGYEKYANIQERELARIVDRDAPLNNNHDTASLGSFRRNDTVVLPPMEGTSTSLKRPTFKPPPTKRPAAHLPPLTLPLKIGKKAKKEGNDGNRPAPLAPAYELPSPMRVRSNTMVIERERDRKVSFARSNESSQSQPQPQLKFQPQQSPQKQPNNQTGEETKSLNNVNIGAKGSRRSRLSQHLSNNIGEVLPAIVPSMTAPFKRSNNPAMKANERKQLIQSEADLKNQKQKRLERSRSEVIADVQALTKKTNENLRTDNRVPPKTLARITTRLRNVDQQQLEQKKLAFKSTVWEIRVTTGDLPGGVSTSTVTVTVYGEQGKSQPIVFAPSKGFLTHAVELQTSKLSNVGDIYKVRLDSSNSGANPDWRCENVIMENAHSGERLEFPCKRWFSDKLDDRVTVREIPAYSNSRPPVPTVHYDVIIHTGNLWNAATLGKVFLEIYGDRGDTGRRLMRNSNHSTPFAKGQVDIFPLDCVSLGEVRFIRLKHEAGPSGVGWFVENIVLRVRELDLHSQFIFPISRWLNTHEGDGLLEIEVRPVDLGTYMRLQDSNMWPFERWKFTLPEAELMFFSCNSHKSLRVTTNGMVDGRGEAVDNTAVFNVQSAEDLGRENTVALRTTAIKAPAFIAFSQRKVTAKADYSSACDLRVHVLPSRAVNLESEKFPNNYISVLSSGQLHPETESAMPGPAQAFFCYVKGAFRDGGIVMLCTSKSQTLCIEKDPSVLTALGKRNKLAHFRVHKVSSGSVRKFESVVFSGCYLQIRKGVCNATGNGDRYCEFRVRRTREQNFVTLESLRERGCFIGFTNTGSVYPLVDTGWQHPNTILFPEIIELGRRKLPPERIMRIPGEDRRGRLGDSDWLYAGDEDKQPARFLRLEQQLHKQPQMWDGSKQQEDYEEEEGGGGGGGTGVGAPARRRAPRRIPRSPYRSQVRRPPSKPSLLYKPKPKPKELSEEDRFAQLSKPPPRVLNILNRPPTPEKKKPSKPAPPPRMANLPVRERGPPQKPDPLEFKRESAERREMAALEKKRPARKEIQNEAKPTPTPSRKVHKVKEPSKKQAADDETDEPEAEAGEANEEDEANEPTEEQDQESPESNETKTEPTEKGGKKEPAKKTLSKSLSNKSKEPTKASMRVSKDPTRTSIVKKEPTGISNKEEPPKGHQKGTKHKADHSKKEKGDKEHGKKEKGDKERKKEKGDKEKEKGDKEHTSKKEDKEHNKGDKKDKKKDKDKEDKKGVSFGEKQQDDDDAKSTKADDKEQKKGCSVM